MVNDNSMYGKGGFYGALNPAQQQYMLEKFPDLQSQEEELARQLAEANALRIKAPPTRMDWASQAARAWQGVDAGRRRGEAVTLAKQLGSNRATTAGDLARLGGGGAVPAARQQTGFVAEDPSVRDFMGRRMSRPGPFDPDYFGLGG